MAETYDFPPYKRLSRSEKLEFRRIIRVRKAKGSPVRAEELATVYDFAQLRGRIFMLTLFAERERRSQFPANYLRACRAVDAAVSLSRRLASDLGLIEVAKPSDRKRRLAPPEPKPERHHGH